MCYEKIALVTPPVTDPGVRGRLPKQLEQQFDGGAANEEDDEYYVSYSKVTKSDSKWDVPCAL